MATEPKSEISQIFERLPGYFQPGRLKQSRKFSFSLNGDEHWTVLLTPERCEVIPVASDDADCWFSASSELFLDVWNGRHTPSLTDFMTGRIKSNNPFMLREFVSAFGK